MKTTQVVVIGLGRFGTTVATTLYQMGHDVLAIDKDSNKVQDSEYRSETTIGAILGVMVHIILKSIV